MFSQTQRRVPAALRKAAAALTGTAVLAAGLVSIPSSALGATDDEWTTLRSRLIELSAEWDTADYAGAVSRLMPDTALLGNGDVGVTSGGGEGFKTFYVSKGDFWTGNPTPTPAGLGGITIGTPPKPGANGDLAEGKPVTASSHHDNFDPERAVNGQWGPGYEGWVSAVGKPQWLAVDLTGPTEIARVVITHDAAARPSETASTAKDFDVQVSDDGEQWTTVQAVTGNTDAVSDLIFDPVTTRHVRVLLTTPTQESDENSTVNPRGRIGQLEVYATANADDVALGAAASASTHHADFVPDRAVNGQWGSGYEGWVSQVGEDQWFQLDLGTAKPFQRYVIKHDEAARAGQAANNPRAFVVEASVDGAEWVTLGEESENAAAVSQAQFPEVTARYVRIRYTAPTQGGADPRARIGQFSLFDTEAPEAPDPTPFHERQNIADATVDTSVSLDGTPVQMHTWTAANDNVVVTQLTSDAEEAVTLPLTTWAGAGNARTDYTETAGTEGDALWVARSTAPGRNWVSTAGLATRVIGTELTDLTHDDDSASGKITLAPGQTVYVVTGVAGGGEDPVAEDVVAAAVALAQQDSDTVSALDSERSAWWKEFWLKSYIDVGDPQIEAYYFTAQYHLAAASRTGKVAPGIFGIWANVDDLMWFGDMHLNYNFQAPFYGVYSSNRPELADSYMDVILDYVPEAERRAKEDLSRVNADYIASRPDLADGIDGGVLYPVGIGPFGSTTADGYYEQVVDSLFAVSQFVTYWEYTRDRQFLEEKAYPLMVKIATFFEKYLEWDDASQEYVLWSGPHEGSWGKNAGSDIALLKYMLGALIDGSTVLDRDADERTGWEHLRDHLPGTPTAEYQGATVYSLAQAGTMNDGRDIRPGDNTVNLEFIHPGEQLNIRSSADERQIAVRTLDVMDSWGQSNSFPKVFTQAARAGYPAQGILDRFTEQLTQLSAPNLRVTDPYHGIEKAGATESINSMLLQGDGGVVTVFPNWPVEKDASFTRLRAEGAFVVSAARTGGVVSSIDVTSLAGGELDLANPWGGAAHVVDGNGNVVPSEIHDGIITVATAAGGDYTVVQGEAAGPAAPQNLTAPTITGTVKTGSALTARPGEWDTTGLRFTYQWQLDGQPIKGATQKKYVVKKKDAGHLLAVLVTAKGKDLPPGSATSATVAVAHDAQLSLKLGTYIALSSTSVKATVKLKTIPSVVGETVTIDVGGRSVTVVLDKNGSGTVTLPKLGSGIHTVKATYAGTDQIRSANSGPASLLILF